MINQPVERLRCNLCGKSNAKFLFTREEVNILRCRHCGLAYRSPQVSPGEESDIYRKATLAKESTPEFIEKRSILLKYLLKELNQHAKDKGKLLDVGCQFGYFLQLAQEDGWEAAGVDISEKATAHARQKLKLNAFTGTVEQAGFADESFDAVTVWEVLNQMPDPGQELKEIWRVLKPEGVISLRLQNANFHVLVYYFYRFLRKLLRILKIPDVSEFHIIEFSPATIKKLLKKTGFRMIKAKNSPLTKGDLYYSFTHLNSAVIEFSKKIFSVFLFLLYWLSAKKIVFASSMIIHARK